MKLKKIVLALALTPFAAQAQTVPAIAPAPAQVSMSNPPVPLNSKERRALELVREWKRNPDKPRREADGSVKYLHGATLPTLICTPLQVCAIRLQEGEVVNDVHAGDASRWKITRAMTGTGQSEITNVVVKPIESGLVTNMIITTDRRSYTVKLVSTKHEWMPSISFAYPDDADNLWEKYRSAQAKAVHASTLPSGQNIAALDFDFRLGGDNPKWKPKRVYTDGVKTYIQFPSSRFADEAPALVALGNDGGLFSDPSTQLVNYRLIGDRFVVDQVLERAALISGVGSGQVKVTIDYEGAAK